MMLVLSRPGAWLQGVSFLCLAYGAWWSAFDSTADRSMAQKVHVLIALFLGTAAIGLYYQWPAFINSSVINDDARQHLYWMRQFQDPRLFQNDLLTTYAKSYQPWGFIALYRLLAVTVDPITAGQGLTIFLLAVGSSLVFVWLRRNVEPAPAFLGSLVFALDPFYYDRINGGFSRAFGFPLLILFLAALSYRQSGWIAVSLLLEALFYPPVFLISAITYLIMLGIRKPVPWRAVWPVLMGVIILTAKTLSIPAEIGHLVTRPDIVGQPELGRFGRYPVWPVPPLASTAFSVVRNAVCDNMPGAAAALLLACLAFAFWRYRRFWLQELAALCAASLGAYFLARALLLRLFLPERYLEYGIPIAIVGFCAFVVNGGFKRLRGLFWRNTAVRAAMIAVAISGILHAPYKLGLWDIGYPSALYSFLRTLDKNALIAAFPTDADNIPVFARRKIFIGYELSHPWYDAYWRTIRSRTIDFFDAYYSDSLCDVAHFCKKYQVDYLVVNRLHYSGLFLNARPLYFEPFQTYLIRRLERTPHFALASIHNSQVLFRFGSVYVIAASSLQCGDEDR